MRIGPLHIGATRTNESKPSFVIASWTPTGGMGYWRWAVWWNPPTTLREAFRFVLPSPSKAMGTRWWAGSHFGGWCVLPFLGGFALYTQPSIR